MVSFYKNVPNEFSAFAPTSTPFQKYEESLLSLVETVECPVYLWVNKLDQIESTEQREQKLNELR